MKTGLTDNNVPLRHAWNATYCSTILTNFLRIYEHVEIFQILIYEARPMTDNAVEHLEDS